MAIPLTQAIQETLMRDFASGEWTQTTRQFMAQIGQPYTFGQNLAVQFLGPLTLGAGMTLLYTAAEPLQITSMRLVNIGVTTYQVSVYLVPSGDTPGPSNRVFQRNVASAEHYVVGAIIGETMAVGDMLYAEVLTAGVIRLLASGRQMPLTPLAP